MGVRGLPDDGAQSLLVTFTTWKLRGTCCNTGGQLNLVTHSIFLGTMNVVWWGSNGQDATIVQSTQNSYVAVIQMDDGTNVTTITATQTFNMRSGMCTITAHVVTNG